MDIINQHLIIDKQTDGRIPAPPSRRLSRLDALLPVPSGAASCAGHAPPLPPAPSFRVGLFDGARSRRRRRRARRARPAPRRRRRRRPHLLRHRVRGRLVSGSLRAPSKLRRSTRGGDSLGHGRRDLRDVVANLVEADLIIQRLLELPAHLLEFADRGWNACGVWPSCSRCPAGPLGPNTRSATPMTSASGAPTPKARVGLRWSVGWVRWTVRIAEVAGSSPGRGAGARGLGRT